MAQPLGITPFQEIPLAERLPTEAQMSSRLVANSIVERRESTKFYPSTSNDIVVNQSGGSSQRVINIRLSSPGYIDLQTTCLEFEHQLSGTSGVGRGVVDNNILSLIDEATLLVGGQRVEFVRDVPSVINALSMMSETQGHHNHNGDFEGEWVYGKYSEGQQNAEYVAANNNKLTSKIANRQNASYLYSSYNTSTSATGVNGSGGQSTDDVGYKSTSSGARPYRVPLAKLFGMFALPKYFPLRNVGAITIQLRFQDNLNRVLVNQQTNGADAQSSTDTALPSDTVSTIKNLRVKCDIVYPAASYVSAVDNLLQNDAVGAMFAVNTIESQDIDFTGSSSLSTRALVFTLGTRYLKTCLFCFRSKADLDKPSRFSLSAFPSLGFEGGARLYINGVSYPVQPVEDAAEAYEECEKALNMLADVDRSGLVPFTHYVSDVSRTGCSNATVDYTGKFMLGFNLDQVLQSGSALGGISTLSGGYNIRLEVDNRGARSADGNTGTADETQCVATGIFAKDVILQIRQNSTEVSIG